MMSLETDLNVKLKIWVLRDDNVLMAEGRAVLLERIEEKGSIALAARSLNMSYKKAWDLIDSMNRAWGRKLVETKTGGVGGGGAVLTSFGRKVLNAFKEMRKDVDIYFKSNSLRYFNGL